MPLYQFVVHLQKCSQHLARVFASDSFAKRLNPHCIRLLICLVDTNRLIKGNSADDQLFKLFCLSDEGTYTNTMIFLCHVILKYKFHVIVSSTSDLRAALVYMVAIILGCRPQSTHLWYDVFAPDELVNTFLPGFMVRLI